LSPPFWIVKPSIRVVAPTPEHWDHARHARPPSMIVVAAPFSLFSVTPFCPGADAQVFRVRPIAHEHDVAESGGRSTPAGSSDSRRARGKLAAGRGRGEQNGT
jgi:hypothetical protein